jgi:hypothetical protein
VAGDSVKVAEVLAIEGSKNVVAIFLFLTNVGEWTRIRAELQARQHSCRWICTHNAVCPSYSHNWCVGTRLEMLHYLAVTEELEHAGLNHLLEDEVLVIVAKLNDIRN